MWCRSYCRVFPVLAPIPASHVHAALQRSSVSRSIADCSASGNSRIEATSFTGQGALLCFDVAADDAFGHGSYRSGVVTAAPQCRQARTERSILLSQNATASSLEPVDDLGDGQGGDRPRTTDARGRASPPSCGPSAVLFGGLGNQFLELIVDGRNQHLSPILGTPDKVILQAEHRPGVGSVSRFGGHSAYYASARYLASVSRVARPAIALSPEGDSFSRRHL